MTLTQMTRYEALHRLVGKFYTMPVPFSLATKKRAPRKHTEPRPATSPANITGFHHV